MVIKVNYINSLSIDWKKIHVFLFVCIYSICIAIFFDDESRNILLIIFMLMSIVTLILYKALLRIDVFLIAFLIFILFVSGFYQDGITRWSTVIYTVMFGLSYICFIRVFYYSCYDLSDFIGTLKLIIILYFIVLLAQQLSVLLSIPPINLRNYDISQPFKLNSLGAEPSWSARILSLLFYAFLSAKEAFFGVNYSIKKFYKDDKFVWFAFLWSMITMLSGTAIVFLGIVMLKFIKPRSLIATSFIFICLISVFDVINYAPYERARDTLISTLTLDESKIIETDHSASFRIVPLIRLFKSIGLSSSDDFLGHGVDSIDRDIDFNLGADVSSTTLLGVWYEYGFIAFFLFVLFSLQACVSLQYPISFIFWLLLVFCYGLNTQIPWLAMIILFMTKNLLKKTNYRKN